jgi:hypothetical protein
MLSAIWLTTGASRLQYNAQPPHADRCLATLQLGTARKLHLYLTATRNALQAVPQATALVHVMVQATVCQIAQTALQLHNVKGTVNFSNARSGHALPANASSRTILASNAMTTMHAQTVKSAMPPGNVLGEHKSRVIHLKACALRLNVMKAIVKMFQLMGGLPVLFRMTFGRKTTAALVSRVPANQM